MSYVEEAFRSPVVYSEKLDYQDIATMYELDRGVSWWKYDRRYYEYRKTKTMPKERPRTSKSGHVYTAAETRAFEKTVKEWAQACGIKPVTYPIRVSLTIHDYTADQAELAFGNFGITYATRGDLDNHAKAILDALNKVAYKDDKQIVVLDVRRIYSSREGFNFCISRAGLNRTEIDNLLRVMKARGINV